jgi:hypothetical protein
VSGDDVERDLDALYELPPSEFTAARNELVKRAPAERRDEIKALKRPSQAAGVVNRLVRTRRGAVEALVEAGRKLRSAQARGEDVAEVLKEERDALEALLRAARDEGGASDAVLNGVRATLQAAAADDEAALEVLGARLERELDPPGFDSILAAVAEAGPPTKPKRSQASAAETRKRERELAQARRDAEKKLREAEQAERRAHGEWERAGRDVERARAALDALTKKA